MKSSPVRTIALPELELFFSLDADPTLPATAWRSRLQHPQTRLFSSPDLLFVNEASGRCLAAQGFCHYEGDKVANPEYLSSFYLKSVDSASGSVVVRGALSALEERGVQGIEWRFSPQEADAALRRAALEGAGVPLLQEKISFAVDSRQVITKPDARLTWKTLTDVGPVPFVEALKLISEGTLDRADRSDYARNPNEAEEHFACLQSLDAAPDRWLLGFLEGECAALLALAETGRASFAVNFMGVVPKQRGKGIGRSLIVEAAHRVRGAMLSAEIDVENRPLLQALQDMGFQSGERTWIFRKSF